MAAACVVFKFGFDSRLREAAVTIQSPTTLAVPAGLSSGLKRCCSECGTRGQRRRRWRPKAAAVIRSRSPSDVPSLGGVPAVLSWRWRCSTDLNRRLAVLKACMSGACAAGVPFQLSACAQNAATPKRSILTRQAPLPTPNNTFLANPKPQTPNQQPLLSWSDPAHPPTLRPPHLPPPND